MKKYEYKIITGASDHSDLSKYTKKKYLEGINYLGSLGWELVSVTSEYGKPDDCSIEKDWFTNRITFYFKRELLQSQGEMADGAILTKKGLVDYQNVENNIQKYFNNKFFN